MSFAKLDLTLLGKISTSALIVYTLMQDRGAYDPDLRCWELRYKINTIANMCHISERCCRNCIAELERCGLLTHNRTGRSSYYMINAPECCTAAAASEAC